MEDFLEEALVEEGVAPGNTRSTILRKKCINALFLFSIFLEIKVC